MSRLFQACFWWFLRVVFRLRYRVEVTGLEKLKGLDGPTLVMPNHPAYIDPPMVLSHIRLGRPLRPVVFSGMYRKVALNPIFRAIDAMEVPDLAEHSRSAHEQTLAMIDTVVAGLERGENFLIYPSGRVQHRGYESIGSARAASEILSRFPRANIVLLRTRGLWGSVFGYARTAQRPNLAQGAVRGVGWVLANLLLFTPRRKVTMTIEVIRAEDLPGLTREAINPYLEEWYRRKGPEEPVHVPYHCLFGAREFAFPDVEAAEQVDVEKIKPASIRAVNEMVEEHLGRPLIDEEKQPETMLDQIGLDSLDRMDVALQIEDRFGFRSDRVAATIGELWALADGLATGAEEPAKPAPPAWDRPPAGEGLAEVLAETLAEAFVRRAMAQPGDVAVADELSGALTFRRLLVGTRLMSKRLATLPGDCVGLLLPASVAADLTFFSLHAAGKLPVMPNWTTGPGNLAHAVKTLGIRRVVTSRKLIDRLGIECEGAEYVFLEDLRGGIGKLEALTTLLGSYLLPGRFLKRLPAQNADDPAVVLFTSGSESAPKAVPLTHRNLICNVRAGVTAIRAKRGDRLLGFLPPFHSFGLTGTILLPLLTGMRVVHYPDPTNAPGLVRTAARYRPAMVFTTPTFLGHIFSLATNDDLGSLRVIVTGAEKCPEATFARCAELVPDATILEGYGITECSPVVSGNRLGRTKAGTVGPPFDGVEVCVVHPETHEELPNGETGLLLVTGPSVFGGYLHYDGPDPFVQLNGKRWYNSGDLVQLDDEGFIHFRGRLKRFLKVGGEMVSLPALEEPLVRRYPATEDGLQVAVEGVETPGGRRIVLFSTVEITPRDANAVLAEAGFRGVMRIDEVVRIETIPVLGTGKTDYKLLRRMVLERLEAEGV